MKDFFEHIDDYMEGKLSSSDKIEFEKAIKQDSSLKAAVENYHDAKKISEGFLEADMLNTLTGLKKEIAVDLASNKKTKPNTNRRWFLILALIGSLILLGTWLYQKNNSDSKKEQLLASYIKPVDASATRTIDTTGMNAFEKGKHYFALNKFSDSEKWLEEYVAKEESKALQSRAYFWLGAALLEQWKVEEAKSAWRLSEVDEAKQNLKILLE